MAKREGGIPSGSGNDKGRDDRTLPRSTGGISFCPKLLPQMQGGWGPMASPLSPPS